jgi:hypothetical protein
MDDIDKLIKKYGHDMLIQSISERKQFKFFGNTVKRGAPRDMLGDLWGLKDVFNHYKSRHPNETELNIADRVLKLVANYKRWGSRSDLYAKELADHKNMYQKVSWLADRDLSAKTIVNKVNIERAESKRLASYPAGLDFVLTDEHLLDNEELEYDPRDYL